MKKYFLRLSIALFLIALIIASFMSDGKDPQSGAGKKAAPALSATGGDAPKQGLPAAINGVNIADPAVLAREKPILVSFAEPMVDEAALQKDLAEKDMPFTLVPPLPGKGRWLTPKSFAMAVESGFEPGTDYSLYFREDLKALDGRPARYVPSFRTRGVELERTQPGERDLKAGTLRLYFDFSETVSRAALAEHLSVSNTADGTLLEIDFSDSPELAPSHKVLVASGPSGQELTLKLRRDREGDASPLHLEREYTVKIVLPEEGGPASLAAAGDEASPIFIQNPYGWEEDEGLLHAQMYISEGLIDAGQKEHIEVSPDIPWTLNNYRHGATIFFSQGLEPGMRLTVRLKPGLTDAEGRVLKEEREAVYIVPDHRGRVGFAEPGHMLSPLFSRRVAVNLVNLDQVNVSLRRQYDNNLPLMDFEPDDKVTAMMHDMSLKEIRVTGLNKNEVQRRAIDLESLAGGQRGVFMLGVTGFAEEIDARTGQRSMSYCGEAERLVVISDIGVTARLFPSGITVLATSLGSAGPLRDAAVMVYSRSNQLIARGFTNQDGLFVHQRENAWEEQLQPHIVVVRSGEGQQSDMTFLPLTWTTTLYQEDASLRPYLEKGFEAFVYTPRGVFRPGETVQVKAFVRDQNHNAPQPFPILFRALSARGTVLARESAQLSAEGGADMSFVLPQSAPAGTYRVMAEIPGQEEEPLGVCEFSVEDFAPPRLEVSLKPASDILLEGHELQSALSGHYLFGAPGSGLRYELGYRARKADFNPEGFEGYIFGDAERAFGSRYDSAYLTGFLPESGECDLAFTPPEDWAEAGGALNAKLLASVQEDGGRWVSRSADFLYFPGPFLLGMKPEAESFRAGQALSVAVAAVDPQGQYADSGPLKAEISLIQGNWHTVYRNNRYVQLFEERLIPKESLELDSENGRAQLGFTPQEHGLYLVRVFAGGVSASRRIFVSGMEGASLAEGTGRMDKVELNFDKEDYLPGESARLTVKAPFAGTLLLGLERGAQLFARVIHLETPGTVIDIPVSADMAPNVTVTANVIRPVRGEESEWYNHRAFGTASLALSKKTHSLNVSPAAPAKALPGAPLAVPFTVTDEQGAPVEGEFSVALVDEGILSLTGFLTPAPADFFLARRYAVGHSHDAYDSLLRPEARATPLLKAGGGMSMATAAAYHGSLGTQPVFLSAFLPTVKTDANGQGEAIFEVPEYSGLGRIMIVGASGSRFASGEGRVRFARDLVLEASAPRVAAPGDDFEISLRLFANPDAGTSLEGEALVSLSSSGPAELAGDALLRLPLGDGEKEAGKPEAAPADQAEQTTPAEQTTQTDQAAPAKEAGGKSRSLAIKARAGDKPGLAVIRLAVSVPGREDLTFAKELQVAVRPPYARSGATVQALIRAGDKTELLLPGTWSATGLESSFSLGSSPARALLPALDFLHDYPYGCLEQMVSRAWPHLALPDLRAGLDEQGGDKTGLEANSAAALARYVKAILALQRPGGGFASWPDRAWPDPWRSVYALWLLNEVKHLTAVPKSALEAGDEYLRFVLAAPEEAMGGEGEALSTKAFAAMVLTRDHAAPLGWMQHLAGLKNSMLPSGRICLAGAMALKAGNAEALKELERNPEQLNYARESFENGVPSPYFGPNRTLESDLRNKALLLWLWSQVEPQAGRCRELCLEVMQKLNASPCFTTQEAGLAALAVGAWLEKAGFTAGAYSATLSAGDQSLAAGVKEELSLGSGQLPTPGPDGVLAPLTVELSGEGSAYAVYSVRGLPLEPPLPASNSLSVSRVWKRQDGTLIDLSSGKVKLAKGDRITVEVGVKSDLLLNDVVLSDLLPGGLEVENPRLNTAAAGQEEDDPANVEAYIDQREDRMLFFIDKVHGEARFSYSLRAVSRGSFALPPLAADAMYEPEYNAVTGTGLVEVE